MSKWSIIDFVAVAFITAAVLAAGCALEQSSQKKDWYNNVIEAENFNHCGHEYIMFHTGDHFGFVHDPDCTCYAANRALPMPSPYGSQEPQ
jgi:hypothetical protein